MDDQYPSEEEYQQKLDEIREHDPNLYEYIMWGNNPDEPFDYDAMEVRLLLAIKEQDEGQKQSVGDLTKMTAMEIAERILAQYGMGQKVHRSGEEIADAIYYNPAKIAIHGVGMYERKEIAPGKFINVRTVQPFTPAWYVHEGKVFGDNPAVTKEPSSGVDVHLLAEDEASTWEMPGKYEGNEKIESAIDWKKLETARDEDELQQQMEQTRRDVATVFGISPDMVMGVSPLTIAQRVAVETQRKEICIELLIGHEEFQKCRDEMREYANSYAARCLYAGGHREYYEMVYRLCAEGYSLEQALHGVQRTAGE